jgi:hypothetical protein
MQTQAKETQSSADTSTLGHSRICRFCKEYGESLVKYGTRHYAHARCGLEAQGEAFLDNLTDWQLSQFPYLVAKDFGFAERVEAAYYRQQEAQS